MRFYEGTIESLVAGIADGSFADPSGDFASFFPEGKEAKFTHMWSTCAIFQWRMESRENVYSNFASIATGDAILVVDDAHCPNKVYTLTATDGANTAGCQSVGHLQSIPRIDLRPVASGASLALSRVCA